MGILGYLRGKVRLRTRLRNVGAAWKQLRPLYDYGFVGKGSRRCLSNVTFYATNRCNSRCIHCGFWQQRPVVFLPPEVFLNVRDSPAVNANTLFGFEGGEFVLHPQADEILGLFKGRKMELFSNGLAVDKVKEAVRKHKIPHLMISLDGPPETYKRIRGVDGFDTASSLAIEMSKETWVSITFTITPWTDRSDFEFIRDFCRRNGLDLGLNIMHNAGFFDPGFDFEHVVDSVMNFDMPEIPYAQAENLPNDHPIKVEYFVKFNEWLRGSLSLPCTSIFHRIVVYPNGDIPLCQLGKFGVLGNLKTQKLEDIWWSPDVLKRQKARIRCNQCWISYHRYDDLFMYRAMKTFVPEGWIQRWMKSGHKDSA